MIPGIQGEEAFRAFLQRRTGFVMPEDRWRFLAPRFLGRLGDRGFADVEGFVRYLEHDPRGRTELEEIYNILTVRKTSFFRNPSTFAALERDVLPRLLAERRSHLPVSIWSAGCSTGEEAHSIAMVAKEVLGPPEHQPAAPGTYGPGAPARTSFHVLATDIVKEALAHAREGVYPESSLQEVPPAFRRYLRTVGGLATVEDGVRRHIDYATHNLVYDPAPRAATGAWDVIFCRNVLIYFGLKETREILARFAAVLAPGGALFLGGAEVFFDMASEYEVVFWGDTFYYRRKLEARPATAACEAARVSNRGPLDVRTTPARTPESDVGEASAATRSLPRPRSDTPTRSVPRPPTPTEARRPPSESGRVRRMTESGRWARPSESGRIAQRPPPPASEGRPVHDAPTTRIQTGSGDTPTRAFPRGWASGALPEDDSVDDTRADLRVAAGLPHDQVLEAERRMEADDREGAARALAGAITRAPRWARPRVLLARLFLRQGEVDHAVRQLEAAAEVEPLDPRAHYLLGKVRADQHDPARAEESFRRALYLEPDFVVARWGLACVYEQAGRADRACKELRTVLRALRSLEGRLSADALDGAKPGELRARCESAIAALGGRIDESSEDSRRLL